jgi:carbonic anhydrase/acetyltransferase-like protein (isoleucine patch superfamily)
MDMPGVLINYNNMKEKNFKLTKKTIMWGEHTLYRIKCIKDIPYHGVKVGDLGGYVEDEDNLHDNAWIYGKAKVYDAAKVSGNVQVFGNAEVYGNAQVFDYAKVSGNANVYGNVKVYDNACVYGNANVYNNAKVFGNANVYENSRVYDNAQVFGNARVYGNSKVYKDAKVSGHAKVSDTAEVIKGCIYMDIQWPITITHNHIKIGCKFIEIEGWQNYLQENWEKYGVKHYQPIETVIDLAKLLKEEEVI